MWDAISPCFCTKWDKIIKWVTFVRGSRAEIGLNVTVRFHENMLTY